MDKDKDNEYLRLKHLGIQWLYEGVSAEKLNKIRNEHE